MSSELLHVDNLVKRYGEFFALSGCTLSVKPGSIFGLLGPNGAGKTTLIRCLLGYLKPTSGRATIGGVDCIRNSLEVRRSVSYLPAESKLFRLMRGADCLQFFTSVHPRGDRSLANSIAKRLDLDLSRRVAFMSTGMRQKLAICCVMSCPSPLIVLDEPTANLDPTVRSIVLELVREARDRGSTVAFCSHVLSEIEEICDSVAILRSGKVVHSGLLSSIRQTHRLTAKKAAEFDRDDLPEGARVLEWTAEKMVIDLPGTLDRYVAWMGNRALAEVQVEMVGLRNLYEEHHNGATVRPS
ncbi:MAG: ABC transporter ATP-binding protein [Pirellula sp.]